jgi:hypothetical protein
LQDRLDALKRLEALNVLFKMFDIRAKAAVAYDPVIGRRHQFVINCYNKSGILTMRIRAPTIESVELSCNELITDRQCRQDS